MDPYVRNPPRRFRSNDSALFFLGLLGCAIMFFSIVLIACAFVVNYGDDFEISGSDGGIEEKVQSEFNYAQYWAGIPFISTGILIIFSGTFQRNRGLTIATSIFCVVCVGITFFVISLDGPNWNQWNAMHRKKLYWDGKSGIDCSTDTTTCVCTGVLTMPYKCNVISQLSALYGAIVGSAICVALLSVFTLLIITKSLSWKQLRRYRSQNYRDDLYYDDMDRGRRSPSFIDLPYAKRGDYYNRGAAPLPMPQKQLYPY